MQNKQVNIRNSDGESPLFLAAKHGSFACVEYLIRAGAKVNLCNKERKSPLHISVNFPQIAHLLILNGAKIDARDNTRNRPLHYAIQEGCLETVCMLLYYNADANAPGKHDLTPFMLAVKYELVEIQDVLFDYVVDFHVEVPMRSQSEYVIDPIHHFCWTTRFSLLEFAFMQESPYAMQIFRKTKNIRINFFILVIRERSEGMFRLIWDTPYEDLRLHRYVSIEYLCDLDRYYMERFIEIMIESSNVGLLLHFVHQRVFEPFIEKFATLECNMDLLTKLTFRLIENSYIMCTKEIEAIFDFCGYCELFKLLLYVEYDFHWRLCYIMPVLIFNVKSTIKDIVQHFSSENLDHLRIFRKDIERCFQYFIEPQLLAMYGTIVESRYDVRRSLPATPSLVQLARDKSRAFIVKVFKVSTASQLYTTIDRLDITQDCKKILRFEHKLYRI